MMSSRLRRVALPALVALLAAACGGTHHSPRAAPAAQVTVSPSVPVMPTPHRTYTWPLTGEPTSHAPTQPALSIKIDNAPAARPQRGLNQADLVFECLVEGGLSRFLAVYQSDSAAVVGPIRSARPVDGALLRALNGGVFAYSGAALGEIAPAKAYSTSFLLSHDDDPRPFYRRSDHRSPDNLYASTAGLRAEATRRGEHAGLPSPLFTYGPANAGALPAKGVSVRLGAQSSAQWTYVAGNYLRTENGTPHLLSDGSRVTARNVVVLRVRVVGSGIKDAAGNEDPFVLAYGSGTAEFLRDGVVETGTWSRPTVRSPFRFTSSSGAPLALAPGRTWIELVPTSGSVALL